MSEDLKELRRRTEELRVLAARTSALFSRETVGEVYKTAGEILSGGLGFVNAIFAIEGENCVLKYISISDEEMKSSMKITGVDMDGFSVGHDRELFARFGEKPVYLPGIRDLTLEFLSLVFRNHPDWRNVFKGDGARLVETISNRFFPHIDKRVIISPMKNGLETAGYVIVFGDELREGDVPTIQHFSQIVNTAVQYAVARSALMESEERFRSLFELSPDAIILVGLNGKVDDVNPMAEVMLGYGREEVVGTGIGVLNILPEEDRFELVGMVNDVISGREAGRMEAVASRKDKERRWVEIKVSKIARESKIVGIQIISRDITERKRAEGQLKKLSQKIISMQEEHSGRLARELHDEVGQQITAMSLGLELMREQPYQDKKYIDELVKIVEGLSVRIRRVCEGLRPMILDGMGLESALESLVWEFKQRGGFEVEMSIDQVGKDISPDVSIGVYRILQESLTNAARHSGARKVYVGLRKIDSDIILEVRDNGKGFAEGAVDSRRGFGMIGMKERAELCGGRLEIKSEPGEGTRVVLGVPVK